MSNSQNYGIPPDLFRQKVTIPLDQGEIRDLILGLAKLLYDEREHKEPSSLEPLFGARRDVIVYGTHTNYISLEDDNKYHIFFETYRGKLPIICDNLMALRQFLDQPIEGVTVPIITGVRTAITINIFDNYRVTNSDPTKLEEGLGIERKTALESGGYLLERYYKNDQLYCLTPCDEAGQIDGIEQWYSLNGTLAKQTLWSHGIKHGVEELFFLLDNNQPLVTKYYLAGVLVSPEDYYQFLTKEIYQYGSLLWDLSKLASSYL